MTVKVRKKPVRKKATAPKKSKMRTAPFPNYPEWSTSKFWGFIRSGLRITYNKWPPKWVVLKAAQRPYTGEGKQQKWEYLCAGCGGWFKAKEVSVDHIIPAGALNSFDDLPKFVEKLFVGEEGLQVLHKECHDRKTKQERQAKE